MPKANTVSIHQASLIFGVEQKTLNKYMDEEGMPAVYRGTKGKAAQLDTVQVHQWLSMRNSGEGSAMEMARLGKTQQEELKLSLENDIKMGQLCHVEDVKVLYSETLVIVRAALEGLPGRLAGGNKALRQKWLNEIRTAFNSATDRLQQFISERGASSASDEGAGGSSVVEVGEGETSPAKGRGRAGAVSPGTDAVGDRDKRSVPPAPNKKRNSSARPSNVKDGGGAVQPDRASNGRRSKADDVRRPNRKAGPVSK